MERLHFNHGKWEEFDLPTGYEDQIDELTDHDEPTLAACGIWTVIIHEIPTLEQRRKLGFQFIVYLMVDHLDAEVRKNHGALLWESVYVRDFPSLLQLMALIKSGEMPQTRDQYEQ